MAAPRFNESHCRAFLAHLFAAAQAAGGGAGGCLEMRVFGATWSRNNYLEKGQQYSRVFVGWYDDIDKLIADARRLRGVSGYVIPNPASRDLLSRADNKLIKAERGGATNDDLIVSLEWLFIDVDYDRLDDISATDEERAAALARRDLILADHPDFRRCGLVGSSGNGGFILVKLPGYPNDEHHRSLVRRAVEVIHSRYTDGKIKGDTKTKNPSRLMALVGTLKCKGSERPERPWRLAELEEPIPAAGELEALDLEAWLAAQGEVAAAGPTAAVEQPGRPQGGRAQPNGQTTYKAGVKAQPSAERSFCLYRAERYINSPGFAVSISGQDGHGQAFDAACSLVKGFDLTVDEARPILQRWSAKCVPPWSDRELDHKLDQADKKPDDKCRGYLRDTDDDGNPERNGHAAGAVRRAQVDAVEFSNFTEEDYEGPDGSPQTRKVPLRIDEISGTLTGIVGTWPKRVAQTLFWETADYEPIYLDSSSRLFAWIDRWSQVNWTGGACYISQERFYEHRRMTAEQYEAIETLPHWPCLPRIYYMHKPVPAPGNNLEGFLSYFSPHSDVDRELIKAMVLTLFWGGLPGSRPAFLVTGPDQDAEQGRGVGKTTVVNVIADELLGGAIDVSPTDQITDVKTRLLSDTARQTRVARLDNVKTLKFSWADLEGLITASEISGKQLYKGEGRRPNTLVWCITLNGASLSKDMAQRCIPIKLRRAEFRPDWEKDIRAYVRAHRWEIIADVGSLLSRETDPIDPKTRWSTWEQQVLSKTDLPEECQKIIMYRQGYFDDDNEERDLVVEKFREELVRYGHPPDTSSVFIPSLTAARWLCEVTQNKLPTNRASSHLASLGVNELRKSDRGSARGWVWNGMRVVAGATAVHLDGPTKS